MNRLFERQTRPVTDPGFGSYWTVNLHAPPGTKRPRKRGRAAKEYAKDGSVAVKKRGRPRKNAEEKAFSEYPSIATLVPVDRSRQTCQVSSMRTNGGQVEDEDDEMLSFDSEETDEYESEEDMVPSHHRTSLAGLSALGMHPPPPSTRLSRVEGYLDYPRTNGAQGLVDRMQIEIDGLRRQTSESTSVCLRLSDQLAEAQSEVSRAKSALKSAENMLEEESGKRKEAERAADEEARMRRSTEEALRLLRMQWPSTSRPPA